MKKLGLLVSSLVYLVTPIKALADIEISPPTKPGGGPVGYSDLGLFVSNFLVLAFGLALLVVLVMLIWGAFEWITSGGDKDHVASARNRIINALIGLAVLSVAFALAKVAGQFLGFELTKIPVPTPK